MNRLSLILLAVLLSPSPSHGQTAFDPGSVAFVLCVTNETKRRALETPPVVKEVIIERAFEACGDLEAAARKSLGEKGMPPGEIDERLSHTKKFIRQNAPDDIDRFRVNSARPR